ncbi:MAG: thiosulfate oxidation carrier complex protein SoxZ [Magnetococcus sp. WYHC-3]
MDKIGDPKIVIKPEGAVKAGEMVQIKARVFHPMESGRRKDDAGNLIPAHYVNKMVVEYGGKTVLTGHFTPAVSANPFVSFDLKAAATGPVKVSFTDNKDQSWSVEGMVTVG